MAKIEKNQIVDAAGFGRLDESDLSAFAGIEGPAEDARIAWDVPVNCGERRDAVLVLCDEHLGLYWHDSEGHYHGYQISGMPRLVRELIAAELLKWGERHERSEVTDDTLDRLGFESVF